MDAWDVTALLAHRATIDGLDPTGPPAIVPTSPLPSGCRRVALLPGSFNPPTAAHLLFAERALQDGFDAAVLLLPRRAAGKEPVGLLPEDRLGALEAMSEDRFQIAVSSHPLYADQAEAAARVFGDDAELTFLVGSDKVLQIFDPAWYADREEALDRLFGRAHLLIAPRSDQARALQEVLSDPGCRRWAERTRTMRLHPAVSDLSSTHVRGMLRAGAEPGGLVPGAVAAYLADVRAFSPPAVVGAETIDAYEMRARLLDALARLDPDVGAAVDLRALVGLALDDSEDGRRLRDALRDGARDRLARFVGVARD